LKNESDSLCRYLTLKEVSFVDELRQVQGQRALQVLQSRSDISGSNLPQTLNPKLFQMHMKMGGVPDIEAMKQIFPYREP
jgi:hypothetical protein